MTEKATGWRKREIVELALEALLVNCGGNTEGIGKEAITALKEALAQPEQEPVAVDQDTMKLAESIRLIGPASRTHDLHAAIQRFHDLICMNATIKAAKMAADVIRDFTPPAAPVQDIDWEDLYEKEKRRSEMWIAKYEKDIGLLEKAGPVAAPAQEPVAWWKQHRDGSVELNEARTFITEDAIATGRRPLVFGDTSPPQRTWVGLSDEEKQKFLGGDAYGATVHDINAIEAKLKEKNT